MTSLLRFRNQLLEVKKARKNQKIKILKTKDQKIVRVKILAKGWDAERIVKNLKSTQSALMLFRKKLVKMKLNLFVKVNQLQSLSENFVSNLNMKENRLLSILFL